MNRQRDKTGKFIITLKDKICPICGKSFHPRTYKTKTCSKECGYKYRKLTYKPTEETLLKRSIALKKVKRTKEWKEKISKALKGNKNGHGCKGKPQYKLRGKNHWNWKGGKGRHYRDKYKNKVEYKEWRRKVFERDNYTCQKCGRRGGNLEAHHVIPWSIDKTKRYDINNGLTLCKKCHQEETKRFLKKNWSNQFKRNGT